MSYPSHVRGMQAGVPDRAIHSGATATLSPWQCAPFLATDIGGTHARLALVQCRNDGTIEILEHRKYACADFASLTDIVADFLSASGRGLVNDAAIGCTGMHRDDLVISNNLPWAVSLSALQNLGIARVAAVNDFVAVAYAVQCMTSDQSVLLCGPSAAMPGPALVVGPGTGLGAAFRVPNGKQTVVLPSEAGQTAFAPGNARELSVLAKMLESRTHVSSEQIASGPGLLKLYNILCALDGVTPLQQTPAEVVDAARSGREEQASEATRIFCDVLGSVLGDLVMTGGATSVYIAGGIMPKMRDFIEGSSFHARFVDKGVIMRTVLEQVPVRMIDHPHKGVIGTASWYLSQSAA